MSARIVYCCRLFTGCKALLGLAAALLAMGETSLLLAQETPERLIDQQPFDRIILNQANGNQVIDVLLLEIPNRQSLTPLPTEGTLELRRLSEPSVLYTLPWKAVAKVELYEQLVLREAIALTSKEDFDEAYAYLEFLHTHYPNLRGLKEATEQYLKRDALHAFSAKRYDEALAILLSLYEFNPRQSGLAKTVEVVTDRLISRHLASRDFAAARSVLDSLETAFPQLELKNVASWRKKFEAGAKRQVDAARRSFAKGDYPAARKALRRALAILPSVDGAKELIVEINRLSPQVVVGVTRHRLTQSPTVLADVSSERVARLTNPRLVELEDFGAEGGIYSSRWADLVVDPSGMQLDVQPNQQALDAGVSPETLALRLVRMADAHNPEYRDGFAGLLQDVSVIEGRKVRLRWRWPQVRPEALLQLPIQSLALDRTPPRAYQPMLDKSDSRLVLYQPPSDAADQQRLPTIVERVYSSEETAITDLVRGSIDVLERIAPWQIERLQQADGITVSSYRLPTIHVLLPNYSKPLLDRREFRRALCYGIDRRRILRDIILDGRNQRGFLVLSGPLPAGLSLSDPLGYAYQQEIKPRPYEPRLAAVLATVARTSLAKLTDAENSPDETKKGAAKPEADQQPATSAVQPLILAHPPDALARTACQTIKLQLDAIGIPVELKELPTNPDDESTAYDLQYTELALWEPLVDMRRLLGPTGLAGKCSPAMSLALKDVDLARNWKEARTRLRHVHEVAYYDLPVIPLWQTVNSFAHRDSLQGIGDSPVSLYQNVAQWKTLFVESKP